MNCLRCGEETRSPGPCDGWACEECGLQWENSEDVFEYWKETYRVGTSTGGRFFKAPKGALAVFSWKEEAE